MMLYLIYEVKKMNSRFKELRSELGLSTRKFAEDLNLTAGTISLIENGKRNLTDRTISDVCRLYHVNENWLRTGVGNMFQKRTREIEIAEITAAMFKSKDTDFRYQLMRVIADMTPEQIELLREIAEKLHENVSKVTDL